MQIKTIEIRDSATFIPAIAIKPDTRTGGEAYLWRRAGYDTPSDYIILFKLHDLSGQYDFGGWGLSRTMSVAHKYLEEHWDDVGECGEVIDVEFILEETKEKKFSEYYDDHPEEAFGLPI